MDILKTLSKELNIPLWQIEAAVKLIDEGNTIPFIARYRKEATGSLDDTQLRDLFDRLSYLRNLEKRKEEVISSVEEQGKLTEELKKAVLDAATLAEVEDIYRPYKQKRKTRASTAREKGLAPLAELIKAQNTLMDPLSFAKDFVNSEKGVETAEDALKGALDIIAEEISDSADIRKDLKALIADRGDVEVKGDEENETFAMYADYHEPVKKIPSHRVLAINRGVKEGVLKASINLPEDVAMRAICNKTVIAKNPSARAVEEAALDSYKRLINPSLQNETFASLFENASESAIKVFSENLGHLLMQPPLKGHTVLGLDPAYRTGCKIAVVDPTGKVLDTTVIYPTPPQNKIEEAKRTLTALIKKHNVTVISIGNGTASRESEKFVADLIKELPTKVEYMVVSEAGASVYSASKLAAEEFPQYDVSLRSAVSIARRLQDPLAELVKIEPKAIGIGQYQHDMPPARLDSALGGIVEQCVNSVGVDLNTASVSLLKYVSGINSAVAKNIVTYREENGKFVTRSELNKVPKLGKKAFLQCAGFLRIADGKNILDSTAVHPESYDAAKELLKICGFTLSDIGTDKIKNLPESAKAVGLNALAEKLGIGIPTISDIIEELIKPGRDPRDELPPPVLHTEVMELKDLKPDTVMMGTVRNVLDFGAFVDIGVHEDGLVHISQISNSYIKHPSQVLKVGDVVKVKVLDVDVKRKRISLTMKGID